MSAWSEAKRLATQMRSQHGAQPSTAEDPALETLKRYLNQRYPHYNPADQRCFFCTFHSLSRCTSGYWPGYGAVWKCEAHRPQYEEIARALREAHPPQ